MQYQIIIINESGKFGDVCLFQKDQVMHESSWKSLAWKTQMLTPEAKRVISWNVEYSFNWSYLGDLSPLAKCLPAESIYAQSGDTIRLGMESKIPNFTDQNGRGEMSKLEIAISEDIPNQRLSTGISMSGQPCFIQKAIPGTNQKIILNPTYFLCFGNLEESTILGDEDLADAIPVYFPPNVFTMYATLHPDNSWTLAINEPNLVSAS